MSEPDPGDREAAEAYRVHGGARHGGSASPPSPRRWPDLGRRAMAAGHGLVEFFGETCGLWRQRGTTPEGGTPASSSAPALAARAVRECRQPPHPLLWRPRARHRCGIRRLRRYARSAVGDGSWTGRPVPGGLRDCRVQGDYYPGASYVAGASCWPEGRESFCSQAIRNWPGMFATASSSPSGTRGTGGKGRISSSRVVSGRPSGATAASGPKPTVALKIEEDLAGRYFYLRLAVASDR